MKKQVLIISRSFYPTMSPRTFRTTELALELVRQGYGVTVLLPENHKIEQTLEYASQIGVNLEFYERLNWKDLGHSKIIGDWKRKFGRILFFLFDYPNIEIFGKLKRHLLKTNKKYDLMITIALPHENHWAAAKVQEKKKIADVWIADCGDPFMGNDLEPFKKPFYFNYLENAFLKNADYVTVPEKGSIKAYNSLYKDKIKVIPQGFKFDEISIPAFEKDSAAVRFAYAGGLSGTGIRSPHKLVEYLLKLKNRDWEFHVFSSNNGLLQNMANESNGKLILHKPISRNELLPELGKMDFLINFDNKKPSSTPSKLIDYSLTGRPILNITAENPETDKIDAFLKGDYSAGLVVDNLEDYKIESVVEKFINLTK